MKWVFNELLLTKYRVDYYYSEESGLLQTESPYWLKEAYENPIADTDTGLVRRNLTNQRRLETVLTAHFKGEGKFLDIGGGYGLLTRLLRDIGFDAYSTDAYCQNLFAKAFEPSLGFRATALLAFEVFEHVENPLEFVKSAFERYGCRNIVFSTLPFHQKLPNKDWWYYSFETGQHITFYQPRSLQILAQTLGCHYFSIHPDLHLISEQPVSTINRILFQNRTFFKLHSQITRYLRRKRSLTWKDNKTIKSQLRDRLKPAGDIAVL